MFKSDILFTGFYGQANTGDDAFVEVASWGAKNIWNKNKNYFLAKNKLLPLTSVPVKGYPLTINGSYGIQGDYLLRNTNALIFAGGSTMHSRLSEDNIRMKAIDLKSKKGFLKVGGIGVSIGPFKTSSDEKAVQAYIKNMDFLAVRDQASFDYLSTLELPYKPINAFDLAALLPEIYSFEKREKESRRVKTIGISVCPYESVQKGLDVTKEVKRNDTLNSLLKEIDKNGEVHFKFFIINGNDRIGDRNLTIQTINKVKPRSFEIIEYSRSTKFIWEEIANCDFVISTRLHAAIFACFAGTPFMLNEYHRKCSDFLQNVDFNNKYRLFNSDYDVKEKSGEILDIINNPDIYIQPKKISEMKMQALLNFTKIEL